jgi:hypothetical protein
MIPGHLGRRIIPPAMPGFFPDAVLTAWPPMKRPLR